MLREQLSMVRNFMRGTAWSLYHIVVVALSAGIALSLPTIARSFLTYWSRVEKDMVYLVAVEMTAAIFLIVSFNYLHRSLRDRTLAKMATGAGLTAFSPWRKLSAQRRIRKLKEQQGRGRTVVVIGSTGYGTFVDQDGDLYTVLEQCMGAHILLVNPYSQEATSRIDAILHPHFTLEKFRKEVRESIALLKRLKATGKAVKLKLYSDPPLVKLAILGDYLWLKHYHTDLDVQTMPEYMFQHNLNDHGLYNLFYQYFIQRWNNLEIPEYDFETDELVYRGHNGNEVIRERFGMEEDAEDLRQEPGFSPDLSPMSTRSTRNQTGEPRVTLPHLKHDS
jgi:hypothetical protein